MSQTNIFNASAQDREFLDNTEASIADASVGVLSHEGSHKETSCVNAQEKWDEDIKDFAESMDTNIQDQAVNESSKSIDIHEEEVICNKHYKPIDLSDEPLDKDIFKNIFTQSKNGYFGEGEASFGGCFVPEILYPAMLELQNAYNDIFKSKSFKKELKSLLKSFVGRPTPLIYARNASKILGNEIYLKFEGLANTGAHKINNALAQILLAKRMGKKSIIAETGAGQHGVAVSSVCAYLGIPCKIFMGEIDVRRQRPNVFIMQQFGSEVVPVSSGSKTLKDAVNEALRHWSEDPLHSFYVLGSALGPSPYPDIVRDSQAIIGREIKKQITKEIGRLPDILIACVGGGSNAMGTFSELLHEYVKLIGIEAGGNDFMPNYNAMRLSQGSSARAGIVHGYKSFFLQDTDGQIANTHSISAGLDYAGISPQLAHLKSINRVEFHAASDKEALHAMQFFARHEGMLPALESSHALAGAIKISKNLQGKTIVVNVSGRGDKDIFITAKALCATEWRDFLEHELQDINRSLKTKQRITNNEPTEDGINANENLLEPLLDLNDSDLAFLDDIDNIDDIHILGEQSIHDIGNSLDSNIDADLRGLMTDSLLDKDISNTPMESIKESLDRASLEFSITDDDCSGLIRLDSISNISDSADSNTESAQDAKIDIDSNVQSNAKADNIKNTTFILSEEDLKIMHSSYDKMERALSTILKTYNDKNDHNPLDSTESKLKEDHLSNNTVPIEFTMLDSIATQDKMLEADIMQEELMHAESSVPNIAISDIPIIDPIHVDFTNKDESRQNLTHISLESGGCIAHRHNSDIKTRLDHILQLDYAKTFELPPALSKIIGKSLRS